MVKSYVALKFISDIDRLFTPSLPDDVIENGAKLSQSKKLKMGEDENTTAIILKRIFQNDNWKSP